MTALTPANQLTLLRMLLIPVLALLVLYEQMGWALTVFVVAAITDALDGVLARRTGQKTTLGAWLDPMADKLLIATLFIVLTLPLPHLVQRIPVWLTVLVLSRDVGIVATVAIVNLAMAVPLRQAGDGRVSRHRRGDVVDELRGKAVHAGARPGMAVAGTHHRFGAALCHARDAAGDGMTATGSWLRAPGLACVQA
jgi:CDP-alcohol phosphatidyltransferase